MRKRSRIVGPAAVGGCLLAALTPGAPARAEGELPVPAMGRLPFAIRDGRIAAVSTHTVPFATGSRELVPATAAALERLARSLATDCFLTAQAIGHASPEAEGDPIEAQALAQARAELVKRLLGQAGLPADAVAALADYRFTTPASAVTLWAFRLVEGADCGGKALPPRPAREAAPPVAAVEPAAAPPQPVEEPAPSPAGPPVASAELQFEPRNSHFPPGAETALKRLVAGLGQATGYRFELEAVVGEPAPGAGSPETARSFQRWLAERRLARVGEWLERNAPFRDVEVRRSLAKGGAPGLVTVRAHALAGEGGPG